MAEIKIGEQNPNGENTPTLESSSLSQEIIQTDSPIVENTVLESVPLINEGSQTTQVSESEVLVEELKTEEIQKEIPQVENTLIKPSIPENDIYGNKLVTIRKEEPKVEEKKEIQIIDESKKEEDKPLGDLFVNYDSEFHKNEKTIIQRIRQFKMTPKTSFSFVLILIVITISGIGVMMKIDPVNHNIDNYKANILALIGKKPEVKINTGITMGVNTGTTIDTGTGVSNTGTEVDIGTGVTNTGTIVGTGTIDDKEEMMLKEKRLTVKPDVITNPDGSISYLYNGKVYTKEELQNQLKTEVQGEINKKTKDYLNKVYIDN